MRRALGLLASALGIALFAWAAHSAGLGAIVERLAGLGWLAVLVPVPQLFAYVPDTLGWKCSFHRRADVVPFASLYCIRLAGEGVNYLTPTAYMGGEPVKAYLAAKRGVSAVDAAASVVVARTLMTLAEIVFIVIGAVSALGTVPRESGVFRGVAVVVFGGSLLVAVLFWIQARGAFSGLLRALRRLGVRVRALETRSEAIARLDREIARFYRDEPGRFAASVAFHLAGWLAGAVELFFHSAWLGVPIGLADAVAIEAFVSVVKGITFFVPGSLGFQESGFVLLYGLFGLPPEAGAGAGILRRARELFCGAAAVVFVLAEEGSLVALRRRTPAALADEKGAQLGRTS